MIAMQMRRALLLLTVLPLAAFSAVAVAVAVAAPATGGQAYATAEEAVTALVDAVRADRLAPLRTVLGPGSDKLLSSGDSVADMAERQRFLAAYDERHQIAAAGQDRMVLQVGKNDWPLPMPLVQADGRWHFDTQAGAQELVNRRIGRNEIAAIRTALAYVDAQKAFHTFTGDTGTAEYAQRLRSSPGKYDGLYWPSAEGVPDSPLEPLVAEARDEGYPIDVETGKPRPYHGYLYRILAAQGADTPKGARSYLSNGHMTNGFALIAWPAAYGAGGIMSFIVNQDGIVYQKDLGAGTAAAASAQKLFDPDLTWARVDVVQ